MSSYEIVFQPSGKRGRCRVDQSLLEAARQIGLDLVSVCGGAGKCHRCKVTVLKGQVSPHTAAELGAFSPEELESGWRLACQTYPAGNCELNVPPESMTAPQRTQVEGLEVAVPLEPPVQAYHLRFSSSEPRVGADSLLQALNEQHQLSCASVDVELLSTLPVQLPSWDWQCQATIRQGEVVALGPWPSRQLGLAVDLGTTKIAGYLVDLSTGRTLAAKAIMNPQISYGEDVISRIARVLDSTVEGERLQKLVVEALDNLVGDLCAEVGADVTQTVEMVVVGNTAMHHLFLGLPVDRLARAPFEPAVSAAQDVKGRDLGLRIAPGAYVHLLPNIAGFVGGDHVAMLLATEAWQADGPTLALDIGTNTEVSLVNNGEITAVSCASGPAFEGGHIKDGMRAASGAIEWVRIDDDGVQYQTIGDAPPIGVCGSGVLDAMAQLYLAGVIDAGGKVQDNHPRVRTGEDGREFVLVGEEERDGRPAIVITQKDVRELQLAKAAVRAGVQVLLQANGCSDDDVRQVIIAGAFGTYIDVSSAITIGMLPSLPLERFRQVGNAAGTGARLALISLSKRVEAQTIADRVRYIELSTDPRFQELFIQATRLSSPT